VAGFHLKTARRHYLIPVASVLFFVLTGCGTSVYYVIPLEWRKPGGLDSVILHYSPYLRGKTIFLDPGHGGDDRYSVGPDGEVVEADVNLYVALKLREFLERAGVRVLMSRTKDTTIALLDRSIMSNNSGADLFISIHHNSIGSNGDSFTNYTSTFYHAVEGDTAYHPVNQDIARYIQRELSYMLGNSGPLSSFDGTLSDYVIYPGKGFSVLRNARIPAVLTEAAFFSSEYEERRLSKREFNDIEAWAIFRGVGRYFKAGVPRLELIDSVAVGEVQPYLPVRILDTEGTEIKSIAARVNGREAGYYFFPDSNLILVRVDKERMAEGDKTLEVVVRKKNGNVSLPFRRRVYF